MAGWRRSAWARRAQPACRDIPAAECHPETWGAPLPLRFAGMTLRLKVRTALRAAGVSPPPSPQYTLLPRCRHLCVLGV